MSISFGTEIASMHGAVVEKNVRRQMRTDRRMAVQLYDDMVYSQNMENLVVMNIYHHIYKAVKPSIRPHLTFSWRSPHALKRFQCQMKCSPSRFAKFVVRRFKPLYFAVHGTLNAWV